MSSDPTATIFYGIQLGASEVDGYDWYHDANDKWAKAHRPSEPDRGNYPDIKSREWDEWRTRLREYEATPEHVEIEWSGGEDCECYFVHCPCLAISVTWNEQKELPEMLGNDLEARVHLEQFCRQFKLPFMRPKWFLSVRYF